MYIYISLCCALVYNSQSDREEERFSVYHFKCWFNKICLYDFYLHLLTFLLSAHGAIVTVKKLSFKKLHRNDSEDKHEEFVDNENVKDVL